MSIFDIFRDKTNSLTNTEQKNVGVVVNTNQCGHDEEGLITSIDSSIIAELKDNDNLEDIVNILHSRVGEDIFYHKQFFNILNDLSKIFRSFPQYKYIVRAIFEWQIIGINKLKVITDNQLINEATAFSQKTGFNNDIVIEVFISIANGLGNKCKIVNSRNVKEESITKVNIKNKENKFQIYPNKLGNNPIIKSKVNLDFWGIPMGSSVNEFDNLLKSKGYGLSRFYNPEEKKNHYNAYGRTEQFIGYGSGITLFESPYTGLVYKVEVYLSEMFTKSITIYNELYPLLMKKYGKPYKDDYVHKYGAKENQGIIFKIQEGTVSLLFGKYYNGDYALYLKYEDSETWGKIENEIPLYEEEMLLKKEKEEQDYKNKLIREL